MTSCAIDDRMGYEKEMQEVANINIRLLHCFCIIGGGGGGWIVWGKKLFSCLAVLVFGAL